MSENSKKTQLRENATVRDRSEWRRPELRKLDVREAQAAGVGAVDFTVLS